MLKSFKRTFTDNILGLAPNIFQLTRYKDIPEYGHFFWSQLCPYIKSQLHVIFKAKQFTICARFKQANKHSTTTGCTLHTFGRGLLGLFRNRNTRNQGGVHCLLVLSCFRNEQNSEQFTLSKRSCRFLGRFLG